MTIEPTQSVPIPAPILTGKPDVDMTSLVAWRADQFRAQLSNAGVALGILTSPLSLRYVSDFRDYAQFQSHIPNAYAFVATEGPLHMYGAIPQSPGYFDERLPARGISYFSAGQNLNDEATLFARDVVGFLHDLGVKEKRVAVEYVNPSITQALLQAGVEVLDAVDLIEQARCIKSPEELICQRWAVRVTEAAMAHMHCALRPGISENQLWALLAGFNIANGGDWCDGHMLCSGPRTNPWLQESTDRIIEDGDLVAFDTDMIGPFGYMGDISRTWYCGDGTPSGLQRDVYQRAYDEVHANLELIKPGMTFREICDRGFRQPADIIPNRYPCLAHGVGMSDEYPKLHYREDWERAGYDGVIEENMVICVESFVGPQGGVHGAKLEQQVLVTATGYELLSLYPFEQQLLGSVV